MNSYKKTDFKSTVTEIQSELFSVLHIMEKHYKEVYQKSVRDLKEDPVDVAVSDITLFYCKRQYKQYSPKLESLFSGETKWWRKKRMEAHLQSCLFIIGEIASLCATLLRWQIGSSFTVYHCVTSIIIKHESCIVGISSRFRHDEGVCLNNWSACFNWMQLSL